MIVANRDPVFISYDKSYDTADIIFLWNSMEKKMNLDASLS
jgi:hypothetical protein